MNKINGIKQLFLPICFLFSNEYFLNNNLYQKQLNNFYFNSSWQEILEKTEIVDFYIPYYMLIMIFHGIFCFYLCINFDFFYEKIFVCLFESSNNYWIRLKLLKEGLDFSLVRFFFVFFLFYFILVFYIFFFIIKKLYYILNIISNICFLYIFF